MNSLYGENIGRNYTSNFVFVYLHIQFFQFNHIILLTKIEQNISFKYI